MERLVSPQITLVVPVVATYVLWLVTPANLFDEAGVTKYSPTPTASFIFFCFLAALILGSFLGERLGKIRLFSETRLLLSIRMPLTFVVVMMLCILSLLGYFVWGYQAIHLGIDFSVFNMLFSAQMSATAIKSQFLVPAMMHGVTIFTQVLPAVLIPLCLYVLEYRRYVRSIFVFALASLVLVLLRTVFNGERLCLMEAAIPAAVLYAKLKRIDINISAVLGILLAFTAFFVYLESTRTFIDKGLDEGIVLFGLARMLIYFTVPVSYTLFLFDNLTWYSRGFSNIFQWVFTGFNVEDTNLGYLSLFTSPFGNPEFNNLGGFSGIYSDLGVLGILFTFLFALITGYLYGQFKASRILGLMLYPLFVVSSLEFYQLFYFGTSRGFVPLLAVVLCLACYIPNMATMKTGLL